MSDDTDSSLDFRVVLIVLVLTISLSVFALNALGTGTSLTSDAVDWCKGQGGDVWSYGNSFGDNHLDCEIEGHDTIHMLDYFGENGEFEPPKINES